MATAEKTVTEQFKRPSLPPHPFTKICANQAAVVVQQKGGNIIRGRAKWYRSGFLKLTDVEIIGTRNQVKTPWILIEGHAIAHLHPDGAPEPVAEAEEHTS